MGFGGGAKLIVPGVSGWQTITHMHGALKPRLSGDLDEKVGDRRSWAEAVTQVVGLDFCICAVVDHHRKLVGVRAGNFVAAHRAACSVARDVLKTRVSRSAMAGTDTAVINAYPLDTDPVQMGKAILVGKKLGVERMVIINAASDGVHFHGMGMGCGVSVKRLLANCPRLLLSFKNLIQFMRSVLSTRGNPKFLARLIYFSLNRLSFDDWRGATEKSGAKGRRSKTVIYSKNLKHDDIAKKYPDAVLSKDWNKIWESVLEGKEPKKVVILPSAPVQLIEFID